MIKWETKKTLRNNLKLMQKRNEDLYKRDVEHQEKFKEKELKYKEEITRLKFELEDTQGFLLQEKECSSALRKERTKLKTKLTKVINVLSKFNQEEADKFNKQLGKEVKNGK